MEEGAPAGRFALIEGSTLAHARRSGSTDRPYWSQALRALREARGITQESWADQLGYGRATVRRWEAGETIPSAHAEAAIIALARERGLFRRFTDGPLAGVTVTAEWIADLLASARLDGRSSPGTPALAGPPPVRYALSGDVAIAYQVFGDGPLDLVVTPGSVSHREIEWEHPGAVRFYSGLAASARVIVFDKRGTGMSDRVAAGTLEQRVDDIRAVMDAEGVERATLVGVSEGGPMSMLFAATYPQRTRSLVLYGTFAATRPEDALPLDPSPADIRAEVERLGKTWGSPLSRFLDFFAPSVAGDASQREWWARFERMSASPGAVVALNRMNAQIDVRNVIPSLHLPVVVIHRTGDRVVSVEDGRELARLIPGAQFIELPGDDHLPWVGDVESITAAINRFLTRAPDIRDVDRMLASILVARLAGPPGRPAPASAQALIRRELARYRGREFQFDGDVVAATFDGPSRAVRCAAAMQALLRSLDLDAACAVHTGEIELVDGKATGVAIDATLAIAEVAAQGEILVSRTVTDLVAGAGLWFAPHEVPPDSGLTSRWPLFRVVAPGIPDGGPSG